MTHSDDTPPGSPADVPPDGSTDHSPDGSTDHSPDGSTAHSPVSPSEGPSSDASANPPAIPPGQMRISDAERQAAIRALGEHQDAGRLNLAEYDERCGRATAARTVDDLAAVFDDLPDPLPFSPATRPAGALRRPSTAAATTSPDDRRSTAQKIVGAAAAASVFVALVLFFTTGLWYWFLLIPAISAIAGGIWGPDWNERGDDRRR